MPRLSKLLIVFFSPLLLRMDIPAFSLTELNEGKHIDKLRIALREVGFLYVRDHGIPQSKIDEYFEASKRFFDNNLDYKATFPYNSSTNAGYLKSGTETLNPGSDLTPDYKEAINFRKDDRNGKYPTDISADLVKYFAHACHSVCLKLLECYALCLQIPLSAGGPQYFSNRHRYSQSSGDVLRSLHYFPVHEAGTVLCGGHSDFGSITLLFTHETDPGGLEAYVKDNFVPVKHIGGHIIVNTGDLVEFWTKSYFKSTVHRVVSNPSSFHTSRYSIAYFCHAEDQTLIETIPSQFISKNTDEVRAQAKEFEDASIIKKLSGMPKSAGEHLQMRLDRIHGVSSK